MAPVAESAFLFLLATKDILWQVETTASMSIQFANRIGTEDQLEQLITTQALKVEELKKKTSYYATRHLLERFESPIKSRVSRVVR
jgi:hypothetical protein